MGDDFKIEHGIPVPDIERRYRGKYPFDKMQPGDSFFVPEESAGRISSTLSSVLGSTHSYRLRWAPESEWAVRSDDGGVRVWRVK